MICPKCKNKLLPYSNHLEIEGKHLVETDVQTCPKCKCDVVIKYRYELSMFSTSMEIKERKKWFS